MSQPDLTRDLACPICGVRLFHVKSPAQSFQPPRTYHEWHHVEDDGCWLRARIGQVVLTATDDEAEQSETIAAWNRRALSEPAAPAGAEVVALEWEPSDDEMGENGLRFISRPGLRFYMISKMWHGQLGERWELNGGKDYATLDEAKAAAQANFAAKIRSALAPPQPVEPPDDSLAEAEPVAWQWRKRERVMKHEEVWSYVDYHTGLKIKEHPDKYEVRALGVLATKENRSL